jgi:hypothetical protein
MAVTSSGVFQIAAPQQRFGVNSDEKNRTERDQKVDIDFRYEMALSVRALVHRQSTYRISGDPKLLGAHSTNAGADSHFVTTNVTQVQAPQDATRRKSQA